MFDSNTNNAYGGYQYNPQNNGPAQVRQPSTLTPDEYNILSKEDNSFTLQISQEEAWRGICNHRTLDGSSDTLVQEPDGKIRCTVCGWEFDPINTNTDDSEIREAVTLVEDILQTIKLLYISMPPEAAREYFQIIPLLEKIPDLFKIAVKDFAKYETNNNWSYRSGNMNTINLYNALTGQMNQPYYGYDPNMQYQQPYQYQQPMNGYQQAPAPGAPMGYTAPPQQTVNPNQPLGTMPPSNGFGYNGPMAPAGYQPQQQGFAYSPAQAPAQPGTQQPTEATSETDGQTVQTQATFKA